MDMAERLAGKVAVITGGASGMGRASVEKFLKEGARVVIADRDRDLGTNLAATLSDRDVIFHQVDVSDSAQVKGLMSTAHEHFGGLDVLFNNAGTIVMGPYIADMDEADFDRDVAVNMKGVWLGMKHALPYMVSAGGGAIVTTASVGGMVGYQGQGGYGAAKAGAISLTRICAAEYAQHKIRANCICPGSILTPLALGRRPEIPRADMEVEFATRQPLRQVGQPEDIADAAVFLASDESAFITGQAIVVDGGFTTSAYTRRRD
jgi:NAD(P)-dependent dehydrogenase (short-subunit alcohol dehydrogenase family)